MDRRLDQLAGRCPLLASGDLATLVPHPELGSLWLRLDGDGSGDVSDAIDAITDAAGTAAPTAQVTGLASERPALDSVLPARRAARTAPVAAIATA